MNLKQMKYVVTLANIGSFSGAAEYLRISQPSLSQYIKKIETELGVELFERANGQVRLTDAGKVYIETGQKMLDLEKNMLHRIDDVIDYREGSIILGASPFRCITVMPELTKRFHEMYPGIQLVIHEMETKELQEAAFRDEFDLCLTTLPIEEQYFHCETVWKEKVGVAVKKGSLLEERLSKHAIENHVIDIALLDGEEVVVLPEYLAMQKILNTLCYQNQIKLKHAVMVQSLGTQLEMVAAGVGFAIVPLGVEKSARMHRDIRFFSFLQDFVERELVVAYRKEKYLTKPMKDLLDLFRSI